MEKKYFRHVLMMIFFLGWSLFTTSAEAVHPLITDDAGTTGKGTLQIETTVEYAQDKQGIDGSTQKTEGVQAALTATFGLRNDLDVVVSAPYQWFSVHENDNLIAREDGLGDTTLDLKWRLFERDGGSLALKPGITLPSGDDKKGLGSGRTTYRLFLIASKEWESWAFHINLGYLRNENKFDNRVDLFSASVAAEYTVMENLKLVANVGAETNPETGANNHPVFALGGIVYTLSDRISISGGVKFGLTESETDTTYLLGVTFKF